MAAPRYAYQKEARGYSVWTLSPHTGDRRDWIADCRTAREAHRRKGRLVTIRD
jgi:hypothetical protein